MWTNSVVRCPLNVDIFKHNFKFSLINGLINVKLPSKICRFPFADFSTDSYPESLNCLIMAGLLTYSLHPTSSHLLEKRK